MKPSRAFLTFLSFAVVMTAYLIYAYAVVPVLLPARAETPPENRSTEEVPNRDLLATLFPQESWMLQSHNHVFFSEKGEIHFRRNEPSEDGMIRLSSVVVMLFPNKPELSKAEQYRQAVIMEAAEAVIEIDGVMSGNVQLKRGELKGHVLLRSDMQNPGAGDNLTIQTQDIRFDQKMIVTNKPVDFQYGLNRGRGVGMSMELANSKAIPGIVTNQMPDSLKRVEILPPVDITFYFDTEGTASQGSARLMCKGKMEAVPETGGENLWKIKFHEAVDVHKININGASDKMTCARLQLTLDLKPAAAAENGKRENNLLGGSVSNLQLSKIEAAGFPVTVSSPDNKNLSIKCDFLQLDPVRNEMTMTQSQGKTEPVVVRYDSLTLTGENLFYALGENNRIGRLNIDGAGTIQGTLGQADPQPLAVRWKDRIAAAPDKDHPEMTCIQISGNLEMNLPNLGMVTAEDALIWCEELPAEKQAAPGNHRPGNGGLGKSVTLVPYKAVIRKNVHIKMSQGECLVNEVEIWFKKESAVTQRGTPLPRDTSAMPRAAYRPVKRQTTVGTARGSTLLGGGILGSGTGSNSQYTIRADKMEINAKIIGQETLVEQIILRKNVSLNEKQVTPTGEQPVSLAGQNIHIWYPGTPDTVIAVQGDDQLYAYFEGRGIKLIGTNININQKTNTVWMDGKGELHARGINLAKMNSPMGNLLPDPAAAAGPSASSASQDVVINWTGKMQFDGKIVSFEKDVNVAYTLGAIQHCDVFQIVLTQAVNFFDSQAKPDMDVNRLIIKGIVDLDHDSYDKNNPQKMISREHIRFNSIEVNPKTGDFLAYGPGYVSAIFLSGGFGQWGGNLTGGSAASMSPQQNGGEELNFLHITFQESVTGNFMARKLSFNDRVRCILYPVQSFTEQVNTENTRQIIANGAILTCNDSLTVVENTLPNADKATYVLTANGKATLEKTINGTIYEGLGDRMRYDQSKEIAVLEGGTYTPAVLSKKTSPNAMSEKLFDQFRKIEINLRTEEIRTQ
ncbi:MAG: LPS export ABC transporter periplasmic protein LptC [Planctomycetaceae bacterium]|jgi:lipopolysaccharide export system protein LptA|nr:LPS export ABC transporter periplasmic protein LptC [Planctomycetaceae bacterium]